MPDGRPWDQIEGESDQWYGLFLFFRNLGRTRTIANAWRAARKAAGKKATRTSNATHVASRKFQWSDRVRAWDEWIEAEEEAKWKKRATDVREADYSLGERLRETAVAMLEAPLYQKTEVSETTRVDEDGRSVAVKEITIIQPADWKVSDIARMGEIASKLQIAGIGETDDQDRIVELLQSHVSVLLRIIVNGFHSGLVDDKVLTEIRDTYGSMTGESLDVQPLKLVGSGTTKGDQ